ncbi:MAG: dephospho-CoA kinase [Alphaproteobacteria bacterium]|nr:dephospho-CoA kinase [Alphaproteobacteria bacterium]
MILLGLTGSIGMGKSATAQMFAEAGAPVYDADAAVHQLYAPGGAAVGPVGEAFPGVVKDGAIDREALSRAVLHNAAAMKRLEGIVHPLVRAAQERFLQDQRRAGAPVVVLDIPLLFEGGGERFLDAVIVVSAPAAAQRARVLRRPGMTEEKFEAILAKQMADAEKRKRADFVINTGLGFEEARAQVQQVLDAVLEPA